MSKTKPTSLTENYIQAHLMSWAMDHINHIYAVPNITNIYYWECDLLSVTRALFAHEFEIKRTRADYRADFKSKPTKHLNIENRLGPWNSGRPRIPNYFWFVTADFDIDPPDYAGWIRLMDTGHRVERWIKKSAPRLHNKKLADRQINDISTALAYRLKNMYWARFVNGRNRNGQKEEKAQTA